MRNARHSMGGLCRGLGVTVRIRSGMRSDLRVSPALESGLPALPKTGLVLLRLEMEPGRTCAMLAVNLCESVLGT